MKNKLVIIILSNLIGIFNAVICGISIPLIRMGDFNFPMIAQNDVPALKVMMVIGFLIIYLIESIVVVNLIRFILNKVKTKNRAYGVVLICTVISGYIMAFIFSSGHLSEINTKISWALPEEVWITTLVYMIGFYFLIIRKMEEETNLPSTVEKENVSIT